MCKKVQARSCRPKTRPADRSVIEASHSSALLPVLCLVLGAAIHAHGFRLRTRYRSVPHVPGTVQPRQQQPVRLVRSNADVSVRAPLQLQLDTGLNFAPRPETTVALRTHAGRYPGGRLRTFGAIAMHDPPFAGLKQVEASGSSQPHRVRPFLWPTAFCVA